MPPDSTDRIPTPAWALPDPPSPDSSRLGRAIPGWPEPVAAESTLVVGVLPGEGIGPEVMAAALAVLRVVAAASGRPVEVRSGGPIGYAARQVGGEWLSPAIVEFCTETFAAGGAVLCGPGGGRFVYDLRKRFDLYCKFSPLVPLAALGDCGVVRAPRCDGVDIVAVRENVGGVYQGTWGTERDERDRLVAYQRFSYREDQVDRILAVAHALARQRSGRLCVVVKPGGVPAISELWRNRLGVLPVAELRKVELLEVDNAVYQLIADPRRFDVIVSSNLFGDIVADCGALLLGSRGLSYSGNFGAAGRAVYQTGHGAASDLAGSDRANPTGQILALAMMLRESFGWSAAAAAITAAVSQTLAEGWRTADVAAPGCRLVGTRAFGDHVCAALHRALSAGSSPACAAPCS